MQTLYYKTERIVYRQGNVIDLQAYRQKLRQLENPGALPPLARRPRRRRAQVCWGDVLGVCLVGFSVVGAALVSLL